MRVAPQLGREGRGWGATPPPPTQPQFPGGGDTPDYILPPHQAKGNSGAPLEGSGIQVRRGPCRAGMLSFKCLTNGGESEKEILGVQRRTLRWEHLSFKQFTASGSGEGATGEGPSGGGGEWPTSVFLPIGGQRGLGAV